MDHPKYFCILTTAEINIPGTHLLSNRKFAKGFEQLGYKVIEIIDNRQLDTVPNTPHTIFLMSDHFVSSINPHSDTIINLANRFNECVFIGWYHANYYAGTNPFKKMIFTGEPFLYEPALESHKPIYNIHMSVPNYVPYYFSATVDPLSGFDKVADSHKERPYDFCYIGSPYKVDWINYLSSNVHKCFLHISPPKPPITGNKFEEVYYNSTICLGFNSEANIVNHVVTERTFEALSFGCLVLSDHPDAEKYTDGATVYVSSMEDALGKIKYYIKNPSELRQKVLMGYSFIRKSGTYKHVAEKFIEKARDLRYF